MLNRRPWTVITGATSGIGYALFKRLSSKNVPMILVSRNVHLLEQELTGYRHARLVKADLSLEDGPRALIDAIGYNESVKNLIHCAGTIDPIGDFASISQHEFQKAMALNVLSPFEISLSLFKNRKFVDRSRILNIGSLAAHVSFPGWIAYCITKGGFYATHKHFQKLFNESGVLVGSVMPGRVDTKMVQSTAEYLLDEEYRKSLLSPEIAAKFIEYILDDSKVSSEQFVKNEWDIYQEWHHQYWKNQEELVVL